MKGRTYLALIALFAFAMSAPLYAQETTGEILGTVTDPTGAAVPGAMVTVTNTGTQAKRNVTTSKKGDYVVNLLPPGTYSVSVSATGFKNFSVSDLQLSAGSGLREDAKLTIGAVVQTVTVKAQNSALQTQNATVSSTVTQHAVVNVPLNGRNFVNLVQIQPGVNNGPPTSLVNGSKLDDRRQTASFSANGQSTVLNNELIDGADNNERLIGTIAVRPALDSIAEVHVETNDYSADVGRTAGAVVNVITKSGTNQFHGDLFEYLRNDVTNASAYSFGETIFGKPVPKSKLRWNQFGGSLGGPIIKNKTFFFGDYEGYRLREGLPPQINIVPTLYQQQHPGDFSDTGGPVICTTPGHSPYASSCTGLIDPVALDYFKMYPAPNFGNNQFIGVPQETQNSNDFDLRVDQDFNANNTMYARFIYNKVFTNTPGSLPVTTVDGLKLNPSFIGSGLGYAPDLDYNAAVSYTHIFGPNLLSRVMFSYTRANNRSYPNTEGLNPNQHFGQPNVNSPVSDSTGLAPVVVVGGTSLGSVIFQPLKDQDRTFQYMGSVAYTHGNSNWKWGVSLIHRRLVSFQSSFQEGLWVFLGYPALLQGQYLSTDRALSIYPPHLRTTGFGIYGEDDWRVTSNITLNLGLRYDLYTPYTEANNHISTFDPATGALLVAGQNGVSRTAGIHTDYRGLEPRIGAAFDLGHGWVIRGGYGITFFPMNTTSNANLKNPPFVSSLSSCGVAPESPVKCAGVTRFADGFASPPGTPTTLTTPGVTIPDAVDPNYRTSYANQFNLTVQKAIGPNVVTVSYVGLLGYDYMQLYPDLNAPAPNTLTGAAFQQARPYYSVDPILGSVGFMTSHGTENYNALQVSVDRRFRNGLSFQVNYTHSHALTSGTGESEEGSSGVGMVPNQMNTTDYGNSPLDVPNEMSGTVSYDLPFGRDARGFEARAIKGWTMNLIGVWSDSVPFSVVNATNVSNTVPGQADRPNILCNPNLSNTSTHAFFNTGCFATQAPGTLGNLGRNTMFGPHFRHLDLGLTKNFPLTERLGLDFTVQAFNLFNTPNFAAPNASLPASGAVPFKDIGNVAVNTTHFGQITSMLPTYTPREFQFALRLHF